MGEKERPAPSIMEVGLPTRWRVVGLIAGGAKAPPNCASEKGRGRPVPPGMPACDTDDAAIAAAAICRRDVVAAAAPGPIAAAPVPSSVCMPLAAGEDVNVAVSDQSNVAVVRGPPGCTACCIAPVRAAIACSAAAACCSVAPPRLTPGAGCSGSRASAGCIHARYGASDISQRTKKNSQG